MPSWDTYSRRSVDFAAAATTFGLSVAKAGTRLGFSITRGIATGAAAIPSTVVDHALFGGSTVVRPLVGGAISTVLSFAEQVSMAPIHLGEYITSTSVMAAHSSINLLSLIFPGSSEASFSLISFINLVHREWNESQHSAHLPVKKFGFTQIARAVVAWVALQGVTHEWGEAEMLKHMRELHVDEPRKSSFLRTPRDSRVRVTSDIISDTSQIIAADIGVATPSTRKSFLSLRGSLGRAFSSNKINEIPSTYDTELKATLRRLSKLVLAGYGGASLLFFGVPLIPTPGTSNKQKAVEEANLTSAIDASEAEAAGDPAELVPPQQYSWWDVLLGRHDQEIFETYANTHPTPSEKRKADMRATAVVGVEHQMPRFWVLSDHERGQIVLILRGTMSLNEIAVDLTCEPTSFTPATTAEEDRERTHHRMPGQFVFPSMDDKPKSPVSSTAPTEYLVHSGMLKMARAMGGIGKPVHLAVREALHKNPDYELILSGHSLGAGVAALLGLMWADPKTCLTVRSSGLPVGRQVSVYCFAPPCLTDAALTTLSSKIITSFVYSYDIVSRLSLASVKNMKNAAMWLCDAQSRTNVVGDKISGEGYEAVAKRAQRWKDGLGSEEDPIWFIAMRKTLEANMRLADIFPPGRVLWAMRDSDMHPSHRSGSSPTEDKLRLFDVLDVEAVFSQIIFAKDMLSAHMPHQYDQALHDLL